MNARTMVRISLALALLCAVGGQQNSYGNTLISDAFVSPTTGWVEAFSDTGHLSKWRLNLHLETPKLMETNNQNWPIPNTAAIVNTGVHEPNVLVRTGVLAPASYEYSATLRTNDDDLLGIVFNYQDPMNYFRAGIRQQPSSGTFGGTQGFSIQKIVGGVVTQLYPTTPMATASPITQTMIDNRTPFELKVVVDGSDYEVFFDGDTSLASGSDSDLASGRMIGIQSWAQQTDSTTVTRSWGTEVESVSLSDTVAGGPFNESLNMASPIKWRNVQMTNSAGISIPDPVLGVGEGTTAAHEDIGNFGQALNKPWIVQDSNGFENGTADNVDFIGPAIAYDEPGSQDFSDYRMNVRLGSLDNDGYGVLVRVQDDDNFYRVTFHNDAAAIGTGRPPRGMSIQKVRNGVWSELYRDDQGNIPFLPPVSTASSGHLVNPEPTLNPVTGLPEEMTMFNVVVSAVGSSLKVTVVEDDGTVTDYGWIQDQENPILTGTVGLHNWGSTDTYYMGYSYGGESLPFLVEVPEPSTLALALLAGLSLLGWVRRRK